RYMPITPESFTENWVVRLLSNLTGAAGMKSTEIPTDHLHHSLPWGSHISDPVKSIWVSKEVCEHLQQRAPLQDERGQHHLCQVHPYPHLGQQVTNDAAMLLHGA
ncbi:hypothetical protein EGW08_011280, partial [Elysia chlorotica]